MTMRVTIRNDEKVGSIKVAGVTPHQIGSLARELEVWIGPEHEEQFTIYNTGQQLLIREVS
jgi:hypothetical protein